MPLLQTDFVQLVKRILMHFLLNLVLHLLSHPHLLSNQFSVFLSSYCKWYYIVLLLLEGNNRFYLTESVQKVKVNASLALWKAIPLTIVEQILGPRPRYNPRNPSCFRIYPTRLHYNICISIIISVKEKLWVSYCIERHWVDLKQVCQKRFEWVSQQ